MLASRLFLKSLRQLPFRGAPPVRKISHEWAVTNKIIRKRQDFLGKPEPISRAMVQPWNYQAELYSFGFRFGEQLDPEVLKTALTDPSHAKSFPSEDSILHEDLVPTESDNTELSQLGAQIIAVTVEKYVRKIYPQVHEHMIEAICNYLTSDKILERCANGMGIKDLIQSSEYPPSKDTNIQVMKALVGCVQHCGGDERADRFVRDFVVVHLVGKDLADLWDIPDPMSHLQALLEKEGLQPPEPRLQWASGINTIEAIYQVGIYSNRHLLGESPGETLPIAIHMAAHNAILRWYKAPESPPVLDMEELQ